jgi:hypothetical protein
MPEVAKPSVEAVPEAKTGKEYTNKDLYTPKIGCCSAPALVKVPEAQTETYFEVRQS